LKKIFAIPTVNGQLTQHFGRCEQFAIVETEDDKIVKEYFLTPPEHQPGIFPRFLADHGINVIIAGGMGQQAQSLFAQNNIEVIMGINADTPRKIVEQYLNMLLVAGDNQCDEQGEEHNHLH